MRRDASWTRPTRSARASRSIPELKIFGRNSTFLIGIGSDVVDPYFVQDHLQKKGWRMNGCQNPPGFHFCITLPQTQPGIAERYVQDLRDGVEFAKHPTYEVPKIRLPVWHGQHRRRARDDAHRHEGLARRQLRDRIARASQRKGRDQHEHQIPVGRMG